MLYHYTTFAAFDGIIRCAELRLNNILNMNDASEMRLFMNGICRALTERLDQNGAGDKSHEVEVFFQQELEEEFHYSAYAACFSEYRDDAAQWERYGYLGQGVCIAFHENLMQKMTGGIMSLQKVYYQTDMREHRLVDDFYKIIQNTDTFPACVPSLQNLMKEAWLQSAAFKHPSFASEKEVRLVISPFIDHAGIRPGDSPAKNSFPMEPKYHVSSERIKKYYPLDLRKMCEELGLNLSDLVGEIIIGPTSSQSLPILQDYLEDCGLAVLKDRISVSECPLRKPRP